MDNFSKCTKSFISKKVVSKIISTGIVVSTRQLAFLIKIENKKHINNSSKLGGICKFDLIGHNSSEIVTWSDCRILAAVIILKISTILLLD